MSKKEMIDAVADKADITKEAAGKAIDALAAYIQKAMKSDGEVTFAPLGKFKVTKREARTGRNPSTGAAVQIPAAKVAKFMPSKGLKEFLN